VSAIAKTLPSTLFSTGGDEINQNCYTHDAKTQADLAASGKTIEQALDSFTQTTHGALRKIGKTPAVWEGSCFCLGVFNHISDLFFSEMVLNHNVTLSNDTIVKCVASYST
jgi:hexosaminidase